MSIAQNERIRQVSDETMVVGVDIASETHYARCFDNRGVELGKVFSFTSNREGFEAFGAKVSKLMTDNGKTEVIVGAEPTGHYWFTFGEYLKNQGLRLVFVNPMHVKRTKELDDNRPGKSDRKDPKTIAQLVIAGRFLEPYIPEDVYAELRVANNARIRITAEMVAIENQLMQIPNAEKLLAIKGIGLLTVAGFFAEIGDLRRFKSPKQIQKLAGLAIAENSSGKWRGQTRISKRGRKLLRYTLYQAVMSLIMHQNGFADLHKYYKTRPNNPLKGKQSKIALCCKLIRIFWALVRKGKDFDSYTMMNDVKRNQPVAA